MTVEEFNKALHAGLGRCVQFLDGCEDREPYREAVLGACLNDYAYDGQCEGTRAWYTYKLLSCFNDDEYFYSRIQHALRETLSWDSDCCWFEHFFDLVLEFAKDGYAPAKELIGEVYSQLLDCLYDKTPEPYTVDYELQWLEHICIECVHAGGTDAQTKIVGDLNELCRRNAEYSIDDFDEIMSFYARESDVKINRTNKRGERKKKCDIDKIMRDIKRYDNTDRDGEWHSVALDIVNNEDTVFPIEAYMYVYTGLCACCRNRAVRAMQKHGLLTDELLQECMYDCYDETRELAKSIINN